MAKYKIGITEAGDAGLDLSWEDELHNVDGAILITKNITPEFIKSVIRNKDKLIIHATITGYGGTVVEPNVPCPEEAFAHLSDLVEQGFPKQKIVVRVDPIIPTQKGIEKACEIIRKCIDSGFYRFRVSIIDMYPRVRSRFIEKGLSLPYGEKGFLPSKSQSETVDNMLKSLIEYGRQKSNTCIQIETCAEPQLTNALQQGCISSQDLELLNLEDDVDNDNIGFQRRNCLCYSGKTELLANKKMLPSSVPLLLLEVNLKIKAFLYKDKKERTIMTKEELATVLNGRQYREVPNLKDAQLAKENSLLIVYGASDDLCELCGAIDDEFDCYDGGEIECEDLPSTIEAIWSEKDGEPSWSYKTDMPHAEFDIYEDDELYCIGMVIDLNEVNSTPMTAKQAYEIAQKNIVETSLKDAKNKESELWRWICTSIEKSAKNGSFKIIVENILPTDIAKKLENIGYEVKQAPRYDEPCTQISWIKT